MRLRSFLILFILFVVALEFSVRDRVNAAEAIFMVYALGFTLEKVAAMQEHGIKGNHLPNASLFDGESLMIASSSLL